MKIVAVILLIGSISFAALAIAYSQPRIIIDRGVNATANDTTTIAENVVAGTFGANVGNGNYTFPDNVTIIGTLYGGSPLKVAGGMNVTGDSNFNDIVVDSCVGCGNASFLNETFLRLDAANDPIFGDLDINGTLNVTGNLSGLERQGQIYVIASNESTPIPDPGIYYNITNNMTASFLNGFKQNNGFLIPETSGWYEAHISLSFTGSVGNEYHISLGINGARQLNCHAAQTFGATGRIVSVSNACPVYLNEGDNLSLMVENVDSSDGINVFDASVYVKE